MWCDDEDCCDKQMGPQGDIGYQGRIAQIGFQGDVGYQSAIAIPGAQGAQGYASYVFTGPPGILGVEGDPNYGSQGSTGWIGLDNIGPQGFLGSQGPQGDSGEHNIGPQGPQGDFTFGPQGFIGNTGFDSALIQGPQGLDSPKLLEVVNDSGTLGLTPLNTTILNYLLPAGTYYVFFNGTFVRVADSAFSEFKFSTNNVTQNVTFGTYLGTPQYIGINMQDRITYGATTNFSISYLTSFGSSTINLNYQMLIFKLP